MIVESYEDTIIISGALRSNYWETLHTAISLLLKRHPTGVIVDCSGLTEVTPAGAATFRDVMEYIHNHDSRVIVAAVPRHILDVLRTVAEVRSQLAVTNSVEEARKSLDLLVEAPAKKKLADSGQKLIVCLTGAPTDTQALTLGAQICESRQAQIHLLYVVIVPRDLPLTAPLAKDEEMAAKAIDHGKRVLQLRHLRVVPHLERARDIASALEEVLNETKASSVIMSLVPNQSDSENNAKVVKSILTKVCQEVILLRPSC